VVDKIRIVKTGGANVPLEPVSIRKATVEK
jgi:hypothetical protein